MILINGKEVKFITFPNGEMMPDPEPILADTWVIHHVSFKWEDDRDLIKLAVLTDYLRSLKKATYRLVIYYMPYSRMDRSENDSPFTLKTIANFINGLGYKHIDVIEPHSDVTVALLNNARAKYVNFTLINNVMKQVDFDPKFDYLVFPDAGAQKRYSKMTGYHTLVGHKKRDFTNGKISGLQIVGDVHGWSKPNVPRKAIIVDDLSSYGGTFKFTSIELKKLGVEEVYLLVAHAENSIFKKDLFDHIDKVFTTDSLLSEYPNNWGTAKFNEKLVVYNVEELLKGE